MVSLASATLSVFKMDQTFFLRGINTGCSASPVNSEFFKR